MFKLALFFLFISTAHAQLFTADIADDEEAVLYEEIYAIFSHSTSYWDEDQSSKAGTRKLLEFAKDQKIKTIASVHAATFNSIEAAEQYYVADDEVDTVVNSEAGQHKLSFPNAKKIYISGGNITLCLCEAVRDVVRGTRHNDKSPLEIILVTDAIYDWEKRFDPIGVESLDEFIRLFYLPSFRCPWQNYKLYPLMTLPDVKLSVYFEGKFFKDYDLEPEDQTQLVDIDKTIILKFVTSSQLGEEVRSAPLY